MRRSIWHRLVLILIFCSALFALFFVLLAKSRSAIQERVQSQIELFREEIVKASVSEDSYTLRRFSDSFRELDDDYVHFTPSNSPSILVGSCGININSSIVHMGIPLGSFHFCRRWPSTIIKLLSDPWFLFMGSTLVAIMIFTTLVPLMIYRKTTNAILRSIDTREDGTAIEESELDDIQKKILSVIQSHIFSKLEIEKQQLTIAKSEILIGFASQVSHDIRSPLSALNMALGNLKEIPEERRMLIRSAAQRINDIANNLLENRLKSDLSEFSTQNLSYSKSLPNHHNLALCTEFIPTIVEGIVWEKRMQYSDAAELEIRVDLRQSYGAFAKVNNIELKRVLSNLINNSVEALDKARGTIEVQVKLAKYNNLPSVEVSIADNGKGIPNSILEKLGKIGVTHGKDGTRSGSGLGISHAIKTVETFGGTFQIQSTLGDGTIIKIVLPASDAPNWFAKEINLSNKKYLVSLDDDLNIHGIWSERLRHLGIGTLRHIQFQNGLEFSKFVNSNINKLKETFFLIDYELLNQEKTGLEIIEELGLEKYSILVTDHHEEVEIQSRVSGLRLSMLPKALVEFIPIKLND